MKWSPRGASSSPVVWVASLVAISATLPDIAVCAEPGTQPCKAIEASGEAPRLFHSMLTFGNLVPRDFLSQCQLEPFGGQQAPQLVAANPSLTLWRQANCALPDPKPGTYHHVAQLILDDQGRLLGANVMYDWPDEMMEREMRAACETAPRQNDSPGYNGVHWTWRGARTVVTLWKLPPYPSKYQLSVMTQEALQRLTPKESDMPLNPKSSRDAAK